MAFAMPPHLQAYWLGEGLAKWATTATPYRSLLAALLEEGMPAHEVHGAAANLYFKHYGRWPGKHEGAPAGPWDHIAARHAKGR